MSVLKYKRRESAKEYVDCAFRIEIYTLNFLSKLSARYGRLLSPTIMRLCEEVCICVERADDRQHTDEERLAVKKNLLLDARGYLQALDVQLTICYNILYENPQGCFSKEGLSSSEACAKLDKMAEDLGVLIDKEHNLLTGMIQKLSSKQT